MLSDEPWREMNGESSMGDAKGEWIGCERRSRVHSPWIRWPLLVDAKQLADWGDSGEGRAVLGGCIGCNGWEL